VEARIGTIAPEAASTTGRITRADQLIAEIDLMFSHIDHNLAGKQFPEENFVFTGTITSLLRDFALGGTGSDPRQKDAAG